MSKFARLLGLLLAVFFIWTPASFGATPAVVVNGTTLTGDPAPTLTSGRVYVPFRLMANALEAEITWDGAAKKITAVRGDQTIIFVPGQKTATVNGLQVNVDAPAKIVNDSTFLPLRFVSETFGAEVSWDKASYAASITLAPAAPLVTNPSATTPPPEENTPLPTAPVTVTPESPVAPVAPGPVTASGDKKVTYAVEIGSGGFSTFKTIVIASPTGVPGAAQYRISDGNTTSAPKPIGTESAYMTSQGTVTVTILAANGTTVLATGTIPVGSEVTSPATLNLTTP